MGLPVDGTAVGGSDKDQGGMAALAHQAWDLAETAGPVGSGGETGWCEPDRDQAVLPRVAGREAQGAPCHCQPRWILHPGDQTRLEVAARP